MFNNNSGATSARNISVMTGNESATRATGTGSISKLLIAVLAVVVCMSFMPIMSDSARAAGEKPAKVKTLTVKVNAKNKVSVKWKKAANAIKYQVEVKDQKSKLVALKKVKAKKYSFKGQPSTKYTIRVRGVNGKTTGKWSAKKKVKTKEPSQKKAAQEKIRQAEQKLKEAEKKAQEAEQARAKAAADKAQTEKNLEDAKKELEGAKEDYNNAVQAAGIVTAALIVNDFIDKIDVVPDDPDDLTMTMFVKEMYDQLPDEAKDLITEGNVAKLQNAVLNANKQYADQVAAMITDLPSQDEILSIKDEEEFNEVYEDVILAEIAFEDLTVEQQMMVGTSAIDKLFSCSLAAEKKDSVFTLEGIFKEKKNSDEYFKNQKKEMRKILWGDSKAEPPVKGYLEMILDAESVEEAGELYDEAIEQLDEIKTKPEMITQRIKDLYDKIDQITSVNVEEYDAEAKDIEKKFSERMTADQRREVENYPKLKAVESKISVVSLEGEDLAAKKNSAKELLDNSAAEGDYTAENWTKVSTAISEGKAAIDKADWIEAVETAALDALQKIKSVPTKVVSLIHDINDLYDKYYNQLTEDNIEVAAARVYSAKGAYEALDADQQEKINKAGLKEDLDTVESQVNNFDLNEFKNNAIDQLIGYYSECEDSGEYYEEQIDQMYHLVYGDSETLGFIYEISAAEDNYGVITVVKRAEAAMAEIKTKVELVEEEIDTAYGMYVDEKDPNYVGLNEDNIDEAEDAVSDLRSKLNELTEEQQAAVGNIEKLDAVDDAVAGYNEMATAKEVKAIEEKIDALDDIEIGELLEKRAIVMTAADAYMYAEHSVEGVDPEKVDKLNGVMEELNSEWADEVSTQIQELYADYKECVDDEGTFKPSEKFSDKKELMAAIRELRAAKNTFLSMVDKYAPFGWKDTILGTYMDQFKTMNKWEKAQHSN